MQNIDPIGLPGKPFSHLLKALFTFHSYSYHLQNGRLYLYLYTIFDQRRVDIIDQ